MADDVQTLKSLNWRALFPFLRLFDSFKIAMHSSKLMLGFLLLLFLYGGGRVLDWCWPPHYSASYHEVDEYDDYRWAPEKSRTFDDRRDELRHNNAVKYSQDLGLRGIRDITHEYAASIEDGYLGNYRKELEAAIVQDRNTAQAKARATLDAAIAKLKGPEGPDEPKLTDFVREKEERLERDNCDMAIRSAQAKAEQDLGTLISISPRPVLDTFFEFEVRQFHLILNNALSLHWLDSTLGGGGTGTHATQQADGPSTGVVRPLISFAVIGPSWLLRYHPVLFILFTVWFLVIWAIFGGAIARISAVHVALDEIMSKRKALRFSTGKLLSFVFAPVTPILFVLGMGAVMAAAGLVLYVPWGIGSIVFGGGFIIVLFLGFLITLALTGTLAGAGLMYPTIAVEGSDHFDAISKGCSYVFLRPWKMLFYSAISLVYGAICFLFLRCFIFVMLGITHYFAGWFLKGKPEQYLPEIWPTANADNLCYYINLHALAWSERVSAMLISLWIYGLLTVLAAFVISFYFSANTIIYYLMRGEIDTNEMSEVYLEEGDEDDWGEPTAPPAETPAEPTAP